MGKVIKAITDVPNKPKKPDPPPPPPPPPPVPKDEGKLTEEDVARRERKRKGRRSTILTSSRGVQGTAPTKKKTLLGQ